VKTVAVIIKEPAQQHEGVRTAVGLLQGDFHVQLFVLHHEITVTDSAFRDHMAMVDAMNGERYSDNPDNVTQYGFRHASLSDVAELLGRADVIIPF